MGVDPYPVLDAAARALAERWPAVSLGAESAEQLAGSDRNAVWRVPVAGGPAGTVVVKAYFTAGPETDAPAGWARESSALAVVGRTALAGPSLLASVADPLVVVMTDLGTGAQLADALLGSDPALAGERLLSWARALGDLHAATADAGETFAAELARRSGAEPLLADDMPRLLDEAAVRLAEHLPRIGVTPSVSALDDFRALGATLAAAPGVAALTPSDACPDNNVVVAGRTVLIDYEGAQFRHVAWDAAYLRVPWPSCWCCWDMPADLAEAALDAYRARVAGALPYVGTGAFERDLAAAVAGWAMVSTAWFLPGAFADLPPSDPRLVAPTRRAMLHHRLSLAARSGDGAPASLVSLAAECLAAVRRSWGDNPLALAAAWRSGGQGERRDQ